MKKNIALLILALSLIGCGKSSEVVQNNDVANQSAAQVNSSGDTDTIRGQTFSIYPDSKVYQDLIVSKSYTTSDDPFIVEGFYDQVMGDAGYTFANDWSQFGEQRQKDFIRGGDTSRTETANEVVKIAVGPNKDGGTMYLIMPVPNYKRK